MNRKGLSMKRLTITLAILSFLLAPVAAIAAGSCTVSRDQLSYDRKVVVGKIVCVGDSEDGSVPDTEITADMISTGDGKNYWHGGFYLYDLWVVVGATAPDAADITITDDMGRTLYTETGIIPTSGTADGAVVPKNVVSPLTFAVDNQDTADATYTIYFVLAR